MAQSALHFTPWQTFSFWHHLDAVFKGSHIIPWQRAQHFAIIIIIWNQPALFLAPSILGFFLNIKIGGVQYHFDLFSDDFVIYGIIQAKIKAIYPDQYIGIECFTQNFVDICQMLEFVTLCHFFPSTSLKTDFMIWLAFVCGSMSV